uniref:Uncharacterized protein n=1 Tax=Clytia hemisphaerica TaxID=252671 RepID=A0A7M5X0I7_9CNID
MKLHALAVYLPNGKNIFRIEVEQALDKAIDLGVGSNVYAVTRSMKRTYVHLNSLEAKKHLLQKGFYDPVVSIPLVVTAQGIPIELTKNDVFDIFSAWGEVTKTIATTKIYRNIRYRNGNWQIHFKRFYKELPNHISAKSSALNENIYITTAFDKAEMIKRVVPTRPTNTNPPPPSQPQSSGAEKTKTTTVYPKQPTNPTYHKQASRRPTDEPLGLLAKNIVSGNAPETSPSYSGAVKEASSHMDVDSLDSDLNVGTTNRQEDSLKKPMRTYINHGNRHLEEAPMDFEVNPTQITRKTPVEGHDQDKSPKKSKTETNSTQVSVAQSAAHQTSNPEVAVRTPFGTKTSTQKTTSGESKSPRPAVAGNLYQTISNSKKNSIDNNFNKFTKARMDYFLQTPPTTVTRLKDAVEGKSYYGHIAWAFFLDEHEWAALMFLITQKNYNYNDTNYGFFTDSYMHYVDINPKAMSINVTESVQLEYFITVVKSRWEEFRDTKSLIGKPYPSDKNWAIWRFNQGLYYK